MSHPLFCQLKRWLMRHSLLVSLLAVVLILAACAAPGAETAATGSSDAAVEAESADSDSAAEADAAAAGIQRETLVVGVQGLPGGMDPAVELSNVGTRVTYNVFDTLIRRNFLNNDELEPALATSWERIDDTTLELTLREGVTFHNGEPFTAADVKFTFERFANDDSPVSSARGYFNTFEEIEIVDDYTVRIHTVAPDPLIEQRLASWASWIVPKDYIEELGSDEAFAQAAVGTGPYRIVNLEPSDVLELERYEDYWEELPPIKNLTFRVIPEASTRVTALVNGEVDIITNIPPDQVATIAEAGGVEVRSIPLANIHVLRYNTRHPVLDDKRLRQAMNLAIDRRLLIDTLWEGEAVELRSHQLEEYGDMFNQERPFLPYDPERARQLVEESDYNGETITFLTSATYYTNGLAAAQAIVEMWKDVGINAEIRLRQPGEDVPLEERMVLNWSNSSVLADPDGTLWRSWGELSSEQRDYWDAPAEFNELGNAARATLDPEARFDMYQQMLDIWEDDAPGTVLYVPIEKYGVAEDVIWEPYSFYYSDFRAYNLDFVEQ